MKHLLFGLVVTLAAATYAPAGEQCEKSKTCDKAKVASKECTATASKSACTKTVAKKALLTPRQKS